MQEGRVVYPTAGHRRSGVKEFVTRLPGAQAIGDYFSKNISGVLDTKVNFPTTKILSISYEKVPGRDDLLLLLGYDGGYDIWDFKDGLHTNGIELVATRKTEFPVRGIRIYGKWTKQNSQNQFKWKGNIAINTVDIDNSVVVRCFSLESKPEEELGVLRFPSRVFGVVGNEKLLIVAVSNRIFGFDATNLNEVFSLSCFPNHPRNDSVMSLGARWLAYPSDQLASYGTTSSARETLGGHREEDGDGLVMGAAQAAMSGLFWLGRKSTKAAGDYIQQRQQGQHHVAVPVIDDHGAAAALENYESTVKSMSDKAGVIAVLDVVEGQVITQLKAFPNEPLTCLAWSPCGSILASASSSGQVLHIYGVSRACDLEAKNRQHRSASEGLAKSDRLVPPPSLVLRYKLVRGVTPSSIRHITISSDNLWCVATTSRRTSHVFAINPQGGLITGEKHTPPMEQSAQALVAKAEKEAFKDQSVAENTSQGNGDPDDEFDFLHDAKLEETPTVTLRAVAKIYSVGASTSSPDRPIESDLPPRHPKGPTVGQPSSQPPVVNTTNNTTNSPSKEQKPQDWVGRDPFSCYVVGRQVLLATADAKSSRYQLQTSIEVRSSSAPSSAASSPSQSPSTASPLTSLHLRLNAAIGGSSGPGGDRRLMVGVMDPDVWDVAPVELTPNQSLNTHAVNQRISEPSSTESSQSATWSTLSSEQHSWMTQIERKTRPSPRAPLWTSPYVSFSNCSSQSSSDPTNPIRFEQKGNVVRVVDRKSTASLVPAIKEAESNQTTVDSLPPQQVVDELQFDLSDE